ncbi:MAG: Z1 domain-containing protein [Prolixibacteraceae bacterium]
MKTMEDFLGLNVSVYKELTQAREDTPELKKCMEDAVEALLSQEKGPDGAYKPVCLLGKIQSGKTRAFLGIIALAFDKGINTIVILTKNSSLLGEQTTKRTASEFHSLISGKDVSVNYISSIDESERLSKSQLGQKRIIVGIKHNKNVKKVYDHMVKNNPELALQKILIIDDEADISSIGYRVVRENVPFASLPEARQKQIEQEVLQKGGDLPQFIQTENVEMLKVALQINSLRQALPEHYFLQVTATPASIFLQPEKIFLYNYNDDYSIEEAEQSPLLSDKTILLPIHEKYVGGEFFFGQFNDPESMSQFCYREVGKDEIELMDIKRRDKRHINNIFKSGNFPRLTEFVDNLLLVAAVNTACVIKCYDHESDFKSNPITILSAIKNKLGGFTAMIHTSTQQDNHDYQLDLVCSYLRSCLEVVQHNNNNQRDLLKLKLKAYFETTILASFNLLDKDSCSDHMKILDQMNFDLIFDCYCEILLSESVNAYVINSNQQISARIDTETGELKRDVLATIYIGGQSLDRGITLQRMVGFFYGRDPKTAQLDTTLQHARLYGSRLPEDLIFTRLYCSDRVFYRLCEITEIDAILRQSIVNNNGNNRFAAIEVGAGGTVRPTNPSRIMVSDCITLKSHKRFLPVGFNTRKGEACEKQMKILDELIRGNSVNNIPGLNGEYYFITWDGFQKIFDAFMNGLVSVDKWDDDPEVHHWDLARLSAFYTIIKKSYFRNDDRIILSVKRGRTINRLRMDGRAMDAPETAKTDTAEMKKIMQEHNVPGLFLFEQKGDEDFAPDGKNYGWNNQRFYWPLLMLPQLNRNILISLDSLDRNIKLT